MNLLTSISNPIKYNSSSSSSASLGVSPVIYYTCINADIDTTNKKIKNYATNNYDLTYNSTSFISNITNTNFDSSTRGCFYTNPSIFATGTLGSGYTFSGSPNSISIAFWIKVNSTQKGYYPFSFGANYSSSILLQLNYSSSYDIWGPFIYSGNTTFQFTSVTTSAKINNWTHFVITFKSNQNPKLYINGSLASTSNNNNTLNNSFTTPNYFEISGKPDGNVRLDAYINELRIYNAELTQTQITTLYNWNGVGTL